MFQYQPVNKNNNNDGKMYQEAFRYIVAVVILLLQACRRDFIAAKNA